MSPTLKLLSSAPHTAVSARRTTQAKAVLAPREAKPTIAPVERVSLKSKPLTEPLISDTSEAFIVALTPKVDSHFAHSALRLLVQQQIAEMTNGEHMICGKAPAAGARLLPYRSYDHTPFDDGRKVSLRYGPAVDERQADLGSQAIEVRAEPRAIEYERDAVTRKRRAAQQAVEQIANAMRTADIDVAIVPATTHSISLAEVFRILQKNHR